MARRIQYRPDRGMFIHQVDSTVGSIVASWKNAPEVMVVQSIDHLPEELISSIYQRSMHEGVMEGLFDPDTNKAYLIASNIKSKYRVRQALFDVIKGHYGLRGFMGEDLDPFLAQVYKLYPDSCAAIAQEYALDLDTQDGQLAAAEEVVAKMAATGVRNPILSRLFSAFRNTLRKIGFDFPVSEQDVRYIAACSSKYVDRTAYKPVVKEDRSDAMGLAQQDQQGQQEEEDVAEHYSAGPR